MQINGNSFSSGYIQKTVSELQREIVSPSVIIDAEPRSTETRPLLPSATEASPFQGQLGQENDRQARFIRLFVDNTAQDLPSSDPEALPQGVQQYLQIAKLETTSGHQRLFDELV